MHAFIMQNYLQLLFYDTPRRQWYNNVYVQFLLWYVWKKNWIFLLSGYKIVLLITDPKFHFIITNILNWIFLSEIITKCYMLTSGKKHVEYGINYLHRNQGPDTVAKKIVSVAWMIVSVV